MISKMSLVVTLSDELAARLANDGLRRLLLLPFDLVVDVAPMGPPVVRLLERLRAQTAFIQDDAVVRGVDVSLVFAPVFIFIIFINGWENARLLFCQIIGKSL